MFWSFDNVGDEQSNDDSHTKISNEFQRILSKPWNQTSTVTIVQALSQILMTSRLLMSTLPKLISLKGSVNITISILIKSRIYYFRYSKVRLLSAESSIKLQSPPRKCSVEVSQESLEMTICFKHYLIPDLMCFR